MIEEIRKAANAAALNIFETMFFTFLDPREENRPPEEGGGEPFLDEAPSGWYLKTELHFSGHHTGNLLLFLPVTLGEMLTMNFMGFEEEVSEPQIMDMASELANMICGNMFSILDKTSIYTLGSPITQKVAFQGDTELIGPADLTLKFTTEGNPITIQLQLESNR